MRKSATVLLFDIDGTLLLTGGAGRRAMERAFEQHCGRPDAVASFSFAGMTDPAILRLGLERVGETVTDASLQRLLDAYHFFLDEELPRSSTFRVLPGVQTLVSSVSNREGVAVGLGTGNTHIGARSKLAHAGLFHYFRFGGFGSDHEVRWELLRVGAERGAAALGRPVEECRVVVIGDTPKDVEAALKIGAECVGVGTGGFEPGLLRSLGAEVAYDDFTHPELGEWLLE